MAKSSQEVLAEFTQVAAKVLENPALQLNYDSVAGEIRNWDSMRHIQIVLAVENHFKVRFNMGELRSFRNLGQMCDNIAAKLAKAG